MISAYILKVLESKKSNIRAEEPDIFEFLFDFKGDMIGFYIGQGIISLLCDFKDSKEENRMSGINKVIIVGNIGRIDVKDSNSGNKVVNVSIATSVKYQDKQNGNMIEQTEWHNVVFFKKLADIASKYLKKGAKVYVEGSLKTEKWQTQSGEDRYSTKIIAQQMQMLNGKQDSEKDLSPSSSKEANAYAKAQEEPDIGIDMDMDDIPF